MVPNLVMTNGPSAILPKSGIVQGGTSDFKFTLLNMALAKNGATKQESFKLNFGDAVGGKKPKGIPYFWVNLQNEMGRITIDVHQVTASAVNTAALTKLFAKSKLLAQPKITYDKYDQTLTLTLSLNRSAKLDIKALASTINPSQLSIDVIPRGLQ